LKLTTVFIYHKNWSKASKQTETM